MEEQGFVDFGETFENGLIGGKDFTLPDEGTNNENAHFDGFLTTEDIGGHQGSVLGKGVREGFREFELMEVVAFCDYLRFFSRSKLKEKVLREAFCVTFYLFIQAFGGNAV